MDVPGRQMRQKSLRAAFAVGEFQSITLLVCVLGSEIKVWMNQPLRHSSAHLNPASVGE
jgi:hypothetical protein